MMVFRMITLLFLLPTIAIPTIATPNGGWDAVWSVDGSKIAYVSSTPHGVSNIWVSGSDGSNPTMLTKSGGRSPAWLRDAVICTTMRNGKLEINRIEAGKDPMGMNFPEGTVSPAWSPDEKMVAFLVTTTGGRSRDLWLASGDLSDAKALTSNFWVREFTWSADGNKIACVIGRTIGTTLWVKDLAKKEFKMLYKGFCSSPAFSPDGRTLAFAAPILRGEHKIVLIDLTTGKEEQRIATEGFDGKSLAWSRDGSFLLFASGDPAAGIYTVQRDGKALKRLTLDDIYAFNPQLSPKGDSVLFSGITEKSYGTDIYTVKLDGSSLKRLTDTSYSQWLPVWSPDGKRLAYLTDEGNMGQVMVRPAAGSAARPVYSFNSSVPATLKWSPDGKWLILGQGNTAYQLSPDRHNNDVRPRLRVQGQANPYPGADGSIYFVNWKGGKAGIACLEEKSEKPVELTTGSQKEMEKPADPAGSAPEEHHKGLISDGRDKTHKSPEKVTVPVPDLYPAISPDGKAVAFVRDEQVWVVASTDRNPRQVTKLPENTGARRVVLWPSWSPDSSSILFEAHIENNGSLVNELWAVKMPSDEPKLIWSEQVKSEYALLYSELSWNPPVFTSDGKGVIFTSSATAESRPTLLELATGKAKILVDEPAIFPSLSPDRKRLAYTSLAGNRERIKVVEINK